jgi:uncharacterized protein (DUF1810 family)
VFWPANRRAASQHETAAVVDSGDAVMGGKLDLERFRAAQDAPAGGVTVYEQALGELRAGRKRTHWMWFVLPQLAGLGASAMAQRYAVASLEEARAYLADPVLGPRLRACVAVVNAVEDRSAHEIFGSPDDLKFRSCLTLFTLASDGSADFLAAISKYYGGEYDKATLRLLKT